MAGVALVLGSVAFVAPHVTTFRPAVDVQSVNVQSNLILNTLAAVFQPNPIETVAFGSTPADAITGSLKPAARITVAAAAQFEPLPPDGFEWGAVQV